MHRDTLERYVRVHDMKNETKIANDCERNFKEDFPKNFLEELCNISSWRRTHDCFGELPSNSPRRVVQYIYRNLVVSFRDQTTFVLKTVFLLAFG